MIVGVCRLTLSIAGSYSPKDKRRVVKSLVERVRHRYNVSTGSAHVREILDHIVAFVENGHGHADAELVDHTIEILTGL